ncbi:MAG: type II secretion system F family protein [Sedimentisphaerales bacterium]|nr:type II secretion system F family protein [Sedimentisphaerales bacterium]
MKLAYKAFDGAGKAATGVIEADDTMTATEALRRRGLYVAEVTEQRAAAAKSPSGHRQRYVPRGQKLKNIAMLSRQLHVLLSSGTRLVDALHAMARQARPGPWRQVIDDLRTRVEEGTSLSDAMQGHDDYFDPVYRSLIAVGESSGRLPEIFDRLAVLKQKQLKVRNSIVGATIYPCMLVTLGFSIFVLLLIFVVPRFSTLFTTMGVPLPSSTAALLKISEVFRHFWWLLGLLVGGAIFGLVSYLRTPRGQRLRDVAVLRLPYIGGVARSLSSARIISLLGMLLEAKIPVLDALRLVRSAAGNVLYQELIVEAEEYVARGEPMSQAFADTSLFSPSIYEAIRSGEQSGEIDRLLLNVSNFLDEENDVIVRSLTSIIEPVILIGMGILVGLIAVCMFLPLFDLTAMTQAQT